MARHLTERHIQILVDLIDAWPGKLTWEGLCNEGAEVLGFRPTRQTLYAHRAVKAAYDARKTHLKTGLMPTKRPESLAIAEQRIRKLESEAARLTSENERLIEQFIRWQYNAQKRGVSKAMLDEHLPVIDRDSSEKKR
ncbi:hypothetical protein REH59_02400 [Pseudomonas sp. BO3-4]|uniref:hypothetical protein n=1 Tax=Pseudomonas sp. BO3-4 TaxID=3094916 RepID=UPI00299F22DC|nr:hypothetical protein [Pseudomonas sp. BO3-4]WPE24870.1 hypothetical protein PshuTeo1_05530 [Pseudomonas hunanensis]WPO30522.1 hypothetical protein REH59_02400 [Pseudomonas sp. BO3-4]